MTDALPESLSFTFCYDPRIRLLQTEVSISPANKPTGLIVPKEILSAARKYRAMWDTGSTITQISQRVVDECGLKQVDTGFVRGFNGEEKHCEVYLVNAFLPGQIALPEWRVAKGQLPGCDVVIGTDIIFQGDFSLTHQDGKIAFSFRLAFP